MAYTFHTDPGHGWLAVPIGEARAAGIIGRISEYSYYDRQTAMLYLEEDCDAALFIDARGLTAADIREVHTNADSFIRRLYRWSPAGDGAAVASPRS
jgi:hypothetical protein